MDKTPEPPATKRAEPAAARSPPTSVKSLAAKAGSANPAAEREAIYLANKAAIDRALEQCNGHLTKLTPEVAREVARRLERYYSAPSAPRPAA